MKAKVLIIEDVAELSDLVALYLSKEGMETRRAESAEAALAMLRAVGAEAFSPDIIILDINLPGMDGFEFLGEYRKAGAAPVLIVSARDADEDIIAGLGHGADEFVTKPFSPRVLVARVRAMLRRAQEAPSARDARSIRFGPYSLDLEACVLRRGEERVALSAKEYAVLAFLAANPGRPLDPETIYSSVWKNAYGDVTAVAVYIQRLRRKLEADPSSPRHIETVYGMGYRFTLDPERGPDGGGR
ncbi:MAG TPA: response regulator transcription factor [Spirochaetales bacterium]|nr:response regulator transcription factor [Spirochaetales bacterium]HPG85331.1 response regulator transcription factor [Spirochaetales bacterium]HQO66068.1 response regulator transcription factor [Spirochaetales bacterium]